MADTTLAGLHALEKEISRLQSRCREIEDDMEESFEYLQENHLSMIVKSVIPKQTGVRSLLITVLGIVFQNQQFQGKLDKWLDTGLDKVFGVIGKVFGKKRTDDR